MILLGTWSEEQPVRNRRWKAGIEATIRQYWFDIIDDLMCPSIFRYLPTYKLPTYHKVLTVAYVAFTALYIYSPSLPPSASQTIPQPKDRLSHAITPTSPTSDLFQANPNPLATNGHLNSLLQSKMSTSSLPKEYKVGIFESKGAPITFKQVKLELPKPGEVLVKVLACGVCHSDVAVQHGLFGNSFPIIPGHEVIGEVAAVPDGEKRWKVGDRVG